MTWENGQPHVLSCPRCKAEFETPQNLGKYHECVENDGGCGLKFAVFVKPKEV